MPEDSSLLSTHVLESSQCSERQGRPSAFALESWPCGTPRAAQRRHCTSRKSQVGSPWLKGVPWHRDEGATYFFFNDSATTEIHSLSLHGALPIYLLVVSWFVNAKGFPCSEMVRSCQKIPRC